MLKWFNRGIFLSMTFYRGLIGTTPILPSYSFQIPVFTRKLNAGFQNLKKCAFLMQA